MAIRNMLYRRKIEINDKIYVVIPTVGEIIDNEDEYFNLVSLLTAMPIDLMAQLDDCGIDFTQINEYDLFLLLFSGLSQYDTSLIFGDLDLSKFEMAINENTKETVMLDRENDIIIDRLIYMKIADALRRINHIEKNNKRPANEDAKKYMIERAKVKLRRHRRSRQEDSQLEELIIAMVNTEQYKYDYEGTRELSIYQFRESVRQVVNKINYDNRMYGVYSGSIDANSLDSQDLNWLTHK